MYHSQTNVRIKLSTLAKSTDVALSGVTYPLDVANGVEGTFQSIRQKNQKEVMGPSLQQLKGALWKIHLKPQAFYDAALDTFVDEISTYLKDGIFLSIISKRNGRTKGWDDQADPKQFEVTYIEDADGLGDLTLYLKTRGAI